MAYTKLSIGFVLLHVDTEGLLLFDRDGKLVYQHAGEGAYDEIERKVSSLL